MKAILAFCRLAHRTVRCTTGHCPVRISFLIWRSRPLALGSRWRTGHCPVHTGQSGAPSRPSGAHRTVRCPLPTVGSATCLVWIARPTVGAPDSPVHTGQSGAPFRPLARPRVSCGSRGRLLAHRTVRCTPDSLVNYSRTPLITSRVQQVRLSQPGAPDNPVHPDRADFG
jgi:hypothetical protein